MRTTLTLDGDVAALVEEAMRRDRRTMKDVVNRALREALRPSVVESPFRTQVHRSAILPGIDPDRLNQLADELEDDALGQQLR